MENLAILLQILIDSLVKPTQICSAILLPSLAEERGSSRGQLALCWQGEDRAMDVCLVSLALLMKKKKVWR